MRSRSLLVVALATTVLVGVGCGDDQVARDATSGDAIDAGGGDALESTTTFVDAPPVEPEWQFTCAEPTAPIATADTYSGSQEQLPEVPGENVLLSANAAIGESPTDSDGDGAPDEIDSKDLFDDPAVLLRGDGRFTFERTDTVMTITLVSDLDGDGRDEVGVDVFAPDPDSGSGAIESWIVPGSTSPGTYDPAEVGVRAETTQSVKDLDGDGVADLGAIEIPRGPTRFWSGAAIGALAAPGDARPIQPFLAVPGALLGFADLGESSQLLVSGEITGDPDAGPGAAVLYVTGADGAVQRFTTAPEPLVLEYTGPPGTPQILSSDEGTFMMLSHSDRSSARQYLWQLDQPCAEPGG